MSEPVIRVEGLGKRYVLGKEHRPAHSVSGRARQAILGTFDWWLEQGRGPHPEQLLWALRDVSFEMHEGEVLGIIGRNGAGKSTLLKLLSRITEPSEGFAEIRGRVGSLLEVGTGMHPELNGRENIYMNATLLGMTKREVDARFDAIVDFSGIERFIDTPVKRYSSGMRVRLGFAIAAHLEPEILIVDEVLAVGDAEFQRKCLGKIQDAATDGRTVLFVSHNLDAVARLCTRGLVLQDGQVAYQGDTASAISHYIDLGQHLQTEYAIAPPKNGKETVAYTYELCIEDVEGNPCREFPVGKPWQVRISFEVRKPLQGFVAALGIRSETGGAITTTWSEPQDIEPGRYAAVFREETIHLAPGRYSLIAGLSLGAISALHYVEDAGVIEIQAFSIADSLPQIQNGVYVNQMDSKISRIE